MSEVEQSRDAKQKVMVKWARHQAEEFRKCYKSKYMMEHAQRFDDLANEIERLQEDIDTFRKLEGG